MSPPHDPVDGVPDGMVVWSTMPGEYEVITQEDADSRNAELARDLGACSWFHSQPRLLVDRCDCGHLAGRHLPPFGVCIDCAVTGDEMCPGCGLVVGDWEAHNRWHALQEVQWNRKADKEVSPSLSSHRHRPPY